MLWCLPTEVGLGVVLVPQAGRGGADCICWDPQLGGISGRLIFLTV